jgi:hypothetical protein
LLEGEIEPQRRDAAGCECFRNRLHRPVTHVRASAVTEDQGGDRVGRCGEKSAYLPRRSGDAAF